MAWALAWAGGGSAGVLDSKASGVSGQVASTDVEAAKVVAEDMVPAGTREEVELVRMKGGTWIVILKR